MIIDFHTHTFPDDVAERALVKLRRSTRTRPHSDGTAEGLRKTSAAAGVGLSVIQPVATAAKQVEHINDRAIRLNEEEQEKDLPSRLLSFGCMHPEYENCRAELRRLAGSGVPGIKLHPYFQGCDLNELCYLRMLDAAAENGLIVMMHAGYDLGFPGQHNVTVPMLREVMRQVKGIKMVAAHMGGWKDAEEVPELLADTGIYLDTSYSTGLITPDEGEEGYWDVGHAAPDPGMTAKAEQKPGEWERFRETAKQRSVFGDTRMMGPEEFEKIVRAFPEDHILFATDSPWTNVKTAINFIRNTSLSDAEKESILGGAAEKLLGV